MRAALVLVSVWAGGCGSVSSDPPVDAPDEGPPRVELAELRALPDGAVDVTIAATVTYVRQRNLHLQTVQVGPATFVFTRANEQPLPLQIGNTVELHVTEVATFDGNKEITEATVLANDGLRADVVGSLSQLLTAAPNEDLESELVRIQRGTVMDVMPPNGFRVVLASNATVELFSPVGAAAGLCAGRTFDVIGVVTEFQGRHQVVSTVMTDFSNVSAQPACP